MSNNVPQHDTPEDHAAFTAPVPRGTLSSGTTGIVVLTPAEQRSAIEVYSITQVTNNIAASTLTETTRAALAETTIATNLLAETDRAELAESVLTTAIATEHTRASAAELCLSDRIGAEIERAGYIEMGIVESVAYETGRAKSAESTLTTNLAAEISRATAAESTIAVNLAAETVRATIAETLLTTNLAAETTRATAAESALTTSINSEKTRAQSAESTLTTNLAAETTRATAAEAALTTNLAAEVSRATAAESTLTTNLAAEVSRATAAEAALTTSINNEKTRAQSAELGLAETFASYLPLHGGTMSGAVTMAGNRVTGLPTPTNLSDAVPKTYVDALAAGLTAYPSVRVCILDTTGYTYANGTSGVGATLTKANPGAFALAFDGYAPVAGERVLVNSPTRLHANGIYILTTVGTYGDAYVFTRNEYFDGDPLTEIHPGAMFYVTAGTVYANTSFVQVSQIPTTMGVSPVQYTQFSALPIIVDGPNVNIVGNQIGVTPTLTNIAAVQLASTPAAGTVTLQQSPASSTYTVSLPAAAPTANAMLKYDGTNYAWSALSGGSNIAISGNTISLTPDVTLAGTLNMGSHQIRAVAEPSAATDAATKNYADGQDATNLAAAKTYSDAQDATNLAAAKTYSDAQDATNLAAAKTYADGQDATNLAAAKTYSDGQDATNLAAAKTYAAAQDATNLASAKTYSDAQDATNLASAKTYADGLAAGLAVHPEAQYYLANIAGYTYNNGTLGIGATLTAVNNSASGLAIDSRTVAVGDRILVNSASSMASNGIYTLHTNGVSGANTVLVRATDADGSASYLLQQGSLYYIIGGATYGGTLFAQTSTTMTASMFGTAAVAYSQFAPQQVITAGANIAVAGSQVGLQSALSGISSLGMTGTIAMGGNKVSGLAEPTGAADAATKNYADVAVSGGVASANSFASSAANSAVTTANQYALTNFVAKPAGYSFALPAAAPAANTYLNYTAGGYTWTAGGAGGGVGEGGGVVAAQYLFVTTNVSQAPAVNAPFPFPTSVVNTGGITQPTTATFLLPANASYKCTASLASGSTATVFRWYTNTGLTFFGNAGSAKSDNSDMAVGYIQTYIPTTISLVIISLAGTFNGLATTALAPWASIEQVGNNTAVTAFSGATATAAGLPGYIPPPPMGAQNSYLRGDGSWVQSNNAPTAAQYCYAVQTASTGPYNTGNFFLYAVPATIAGSAIAQTSATQFTLQVGYTYKCTADLCQVTGGVNYKWYNVTTSASFGTQGSLNYAAQSSTAIGYITPTVTTVIGVYFSGGSGGVTVNGGNQSANGALPWATIEVVSNNNTIGPFMGATQNTNGIVGYIPAPPAGTQNSYLRGDGTWQQANNAPTAASYVFAVAPSVKTVATAYTIVWPTTGNITIAGNMIAAYNTTTWSLQPGATYRVMVGYGAGYMNTNTGGSFQININGGQAPYSNNGSAMPGNGNWTSNNTTLAYVAVPTTPSLLTVVWTGVTSNDGLGAGGDIISTATQTGVWLSIEQVSNNNTIGPFMGATSSTNGVVGYIPAPPAGTQNSYLRGDGTWQQANNAPTAAQYLMVTQPNLQTVSTGTVFPWSTTPMMSTGGGAITQASTTQFQLAAGYTFKLTSALNYITSATTECSYCWYDLTNAKSIGVGGDVSCPSNPQNGTAVAYISTTVTTTVQLRIVFTSSSGTVAAFDANGNRVSWATIEVVSNNNTITAFTGATASTSGIVGYIPAPPAGSQNSYLRGDGNWVQANNAPTAAGYLHVSNQSSGNLTIAIGQPFQYTATLASASSIVTTNSPTAITQFTLLPGYAYKCTAAMGYCNPSSGEVKFQWSNVTAGSPGTYFGVLGDQHGSAYIISQAIGYITNNTAANMIVSVIVLSTGTINPANGINPWALIEVVSNNNNILPFGGSSVLNNTAIAGTAGYVPAPPAGSQNSYLRGDGTWQTALTGPTAALYIFAANLLTQTIGAVPYAFQFSTISSSGITMPNATTFALTVGYTYKCMYSIGWMSAQSKNYQWYNVTAGAYIGEGGSPVTGQSTIAIAYITPTVPTVVALYFQTGAGDTVHGQNTDSFQRGAWATIEAVGNSSAISAFTGATSTASGTVGYIPPPPPGAQNSYLRGDGIWAQANNAPTAAICMHVAYVAAAGSAAIATTNGAAFPYNTITFSTGTSGVITPSPNVTNITTFVLAAGNTYKCIAQMGYSNQLADYMYQWSTVPYVAGTTTVFGVVGDMNNGAPRGNTAIGYITVTTPTTVSVMVLANGSGSFISVGGVNGLINAPWATIEVVSNNNAIVPFSGATNTASGIQGYIPAPPAGAQNLFLRGDGTWAGGYANAPTAAQYLMVTNYANTPMATVPAPIPFANVVAGTTSLQSSTTQFSLAVGYTYKCTGAVGFGTIAMCYQWYNVTTSAYVGEAGTYGQSPAQSSTALAYITPTNPTILSLYLTTGVGTINGHLSDSSQRGPWATIEVVSNNNVVSNFVGATSSTSSVSGLVPLATAGQQSLFLRGDGTWAGGYANSPTSAQYYFTASVTDQTTGTGSTYLVQYPVSGYSVVGSGSSAITQPTTTTFVLLPGYSYKCTAGIPLMFCGSAAAVSYIQFRGTNGTLYGTPGMILGANNAESTNLNSNNTAIAYISPVTTITLTVQLSNRAGASNTIPGLVSTAASAYGSTGGAWVAIEVMSNNTSVSAFTGALSDGTTAGLLGYVPAPAAGQQGSFLRGDGTWASVAGSTPTAAQYYYIVSGADQTTMVSPYTINYTASSIPVASSGNITHPTATTFVLPAGGTYKCTAGIGGFNNYFVSNAITLQFYNNTTGSAIGNMCEILPANNASSISSNGMCVAYVTAATNTTISVVTSTVLGASPGLIIHGAVSANGYNSGAWVAIDMVSNSNTIAQFSAASTNSAGALGYVPAPLAGQQGMFLRGDGTWAGNSPAAPVAAEYLMATNYATVTVSTINTPISFPNLMAGTSSKITQPTSTTFVLAANCTYKCTGALSYVNTASMVYQWYNVTTSTLIGVAGCILNNQSPTALVYITPTVTTTISLYLTWAPGEIRGQLYDQYQRGPWVLIELVSNGTAVAQFSGATALVPGSSGFIPAPVAGQQGAFLRGDGTWANAVGTPVSAEFYYVGTTVTSNSTTGTSIVFVPSTAISSGSAITQISGSQFQLAPGRTYKCTATVPTSSGGNLMYWWYDESMTIALGVTGECNDPQVLNLTVCYVTTNSSTKIVSLRTGNASSTLYGTTADTWRRGPWCSIEVVANNSAIAQFTGATAITAGAAGFMPAPQAGQQNTFLRGDGTWTGTLSAPTAAQYCYAKQDVATAVYSTGNYFAFAVPAQIAGSAITQTSATQFTLQPNQTYKCTADLCQISSGINYKWYNVTMSSTFGNVAFMNQNQSPTALGYITPTVTTVISLYIVDSGGNTVYGTNQDFRGTRAWATIEVVQNGTAVAQFAGASAGSAGQIGYVPQPSAGQQNMYLRGDGTWSGYVGSPSEYLMVKLTADLPAIAASTDIVFGTTAQQIGTTIAYNSTTGVFTLPAGRTFELVATINCTTFSISATGSINLTWVDAATNTPLVSAVQSSVVPLTSTSAVSATPQSYALLTTAAVTTCKLRCVAATGTATASYLNSYAMIKILADGTAVAPMVGATASTNGVAGFMPAPQAGQHNWFLRGDGTWSGYAGSAIEQVVATRTAAVPAFGAINSIVAYDTRYSGSGSSIAFNSATGVFTLPAGRTFDLHGVTRATGFSNTTTGSITLAWVYFSNNNVIPGSTVAVLVPGTSENSDNAVYEATLNITTVVATAVALMVTGSNTTAALDTASSYARVKMVADGTAVAQIVGATASTAGVQGFMPAPQAGQQNMFLRGDGTWSGVALSVNEKITVGCAADVSFGTAGTAVPYTTTTYVSGTSIVFNAATSMFTLVAGNQYELYATTWANNYTNTTGGQIVLAWADSLGNVLPGAVQAVVAPKTNTTTNATANATATITPSATMQVQVLVLSNVGTATLDSTACYAKVTLVSSLPSVSAVSGATATSSGATGLVPAPQAGQHLSFLRGDGTWSSRVGAATNPNTVACQGILASVVVINAGTMYSAAPIVTISAPPAGGVRATAVASVSAGSLVSITLVNAGQGYTADPTVTVGPPGTGGVQATAIAYAWVSGLERYNGCGNMCSTSGSNAYIMADGSARSVGDNRHGRAGLGTDGNTYLLPQPMIWLENGWTAPMAVKIWGFYHGKFVLGSDGYLYATGYSANSGLGMGTTNVTSYGLRRVLLPCGVVQFSCSVGFNGGDNGVNDCLALLSNGQLWGWGWNGYGELGLGASTSQQSTPVRLSMLVGSTRTYIDTLYTITQINMVGMGLPGSTPGNVNSFVLLSNGQVLSSGGNSYSICSGLAGNTSNIVTFGFVYATQLMVTGSLGSGAPTSVVYSGSGAANLNASGTTITVSVAGTYTVTIATMSNSTTGGTPTVNIRKNGTSVASFTFPSANSTGSLTTSPAVTCAANDQITITTSSAINVATYTVTGVGILTGITQVVPNAADWFGTVYFYQGATNTVYASGYNGAGTYGNGTQVSQSYASECFTLPNPIISLVATGNVISAGSNGSAFALTSAGLYAWGYTESFWTIASGSTTTTTKLLLTPTLIWPILNGPTGTIKKVIATSSSSPGSYTCVAVLLTDGRIYYLGQNQNGIGGSGSTSITATWQQSLLHRRDIVDIMYMGDVNGQNLNVLTSTGEVYVSGVNSGGQHGIGSTMTRPNFSKMMF